MESNKVIHVHLIFEKKDFYFGSISAIFEALDANIIGMTKNNYCMQVLQKEVLYVLVEHL